MAIIKALEEWRQEFKGATYPGQLLTDLKNIQHFMTKKILNWRHARWSEFSTRLDYQIVYWPGKSKGKADALTRRPGDLPLGGDERLNHMEQVVRKPQNLPEQLRLLAESPPALGHPSISYPMPKAYEIDSLPRRILDAIRRKSGLQEITIAACIVQEGLTRYRGSLYVLDDDEFDLCVIQKHHNTALAGRPWMGKIFDVLDSEFY